MEFTLASKALEKVMKIVSRARGRSTIMPILAGVKIAVAEGKATFCSTDLERVIIYTVSIEIENIHDTGTILLNGELLEKIAKTISGDTVQFTATPGTGRVEITSGNTRFELPQLALEDYPEVPKLPAEPIVNVARHELARSLELVTYAALSDSRASSLALTGVYIVITDESMRFVATNGYRLAFREIALSEKPKRTGGFLVSADFLGEVAKILPHLPEAATVNIFQAEQYIFFEAGPAIFSGRLIEESYPDFEKVIPKDHPIAVHILREPFLEALERAQITSAEESGAVILILEGNELEVRAQDAAKGQAHERIPVGNRRNSSLKISFRAEYLIDALRRLASPSVTLRLADPESAGLLEPDHDVDIGFQYVLMPIRMEG